MDSCCASAYACGVAGAGFTRHACWKFFSATSFFASGVVYLPISPRYSIPIFFLSFYISYVVVGYGIVPRWLVYLCIGCALSPLPYAPTASSHLFFCLLFDSHEIPFILCMCLRLAFFTFR